jgi:phosphoglycolate phosphatase
LFKLAGTSVALGNAPENVQSRATFSTQGHAGDGVIEALEKIQLKILEK